MVGHNPCCFRTLPPCTQSSTTRYCTCRGRSLERHQHQARKPPQQRWWVQQLDAPSWPPSLPVSSRSACQAACLVEDGLAWLRFIAPANTLTMLSRVTAVDDAWTSAGAAAVCIPIQCTLARLQSSRAEHRGLSAYAAWQTHCAAAYGQHARACGVIPSCCFPKLQILHIWHRTASSSQV